MTVVPPSLQSALMKSMATAIAGSKRAKRFVTFATLTVADTLLDLLGAQRIQAIERWKTLQADQRP